MDYTALIREAAGNALKGCTESASVLLLFKESNSAVKKTLLEASSKKIVDIIKTCTEGIEKVRIQLARECALMKFHHLRIETLPCIWRKVLVELGVPEEKTVILQSINRLLFNSVVLEDFTKRYATLPPEQQVSVSMCI